MILTHRQLPPHSTATDLCDKITASHDPVWPMLYKCCYESHDVVLFFVIAPALW